jgi:hypothetical protein
MSHFVKLQAMWQLSSAFVGGNFRYFAIFLFVTLNEAVETSENSNRFYYHRHRRRLKCIN